MKTKAVLVRLPEGIVKDIDKEVKKGYYTSRAELIKDSVREKMEQREKLEEAIRVLDSLKGSVKNIKRLTKEERDQVAEEYLKDPDSSKILRKYGFDNIR